MKSKSSIDCTALCCMPQTMALVVLEKNLRAFLSILLWTLLILASSSAEIGGSLIDCVGEPTPFIYFLTIPKWIFFFCGLIEFFDYSNCECNKYVKANTYIQDRYKKQKNKIIKKKNNSNKTQTIKKYRIQCKSWTFLMVNRISGFVFFLISSIQLGEYVIMCGGGGWGGFWWR